MSGDVVETRFNDIKPFIVHTKTCCIARTARTFYGKIQKNLVMKGKSGCFEREKIYIFTIPSESSLCKQKMKSC